MKRSAILFGILSILLVPGCGTQSHRTLYIYNWTYYIPDEVLRDFEKKYNVKLVYDMYASNEEMFAKLKAGGKGYDLVFPSGDYVSIMIKENMLEEIDKSAIPNFSNIDGSVLSKITYDPACSFSVPYMMGAAGVTVNTKYVKDFKKSWSIYGRPDLRGRMTLLDDMREVLGAALITLGYSVNSTDSAELETAKKVVMNWRENIIKFDAEAFGKGYAAEEFWVVHGYAENVFLELDSSMLPHTQFFIPEEGSSMYIDNMCILKGAKNKDLANQFINFIHDPQVYAVIADFLKLPSINTKADIYRKVTPNYTLKDLEKSQIKDDLGEALELYNRIWQEIRIGK
jgi:spermidine/putrescine transport system substrate-binding protein